MKFLDYADLRERGIRYSKPHLWRLWTSGKFPKPIKLSTSRNAWTEDAIQQWMEDVAAGEEPAA
jgi:prophage regulatory protein